MSNLDPDDEKPFELSAFKLPFSSRKVGRTREGGKIGCYELVALVEAAQVRRNSDQGGADVRGFSHREKNANA